MVIEVENGRAGIEIQSCYKAHMLSHLTSAMKTAMTKV